MPKHTLMSVLIHRPLSRSVRKIQKKTLLAASCLSIRVEQLGS